MFKDLEEINSRPLPFQFYTAEELWTDEHTSKRMLDFHLNESIDVASRNKGFIERSAEWIISRFGIDADASVADFGCGPGLYTTRLAGTGAEVTGIDFSGSTIGYARRTAAEKGLDIRYIEQNYLDFETDERFDLITMIMCDFCALSPEQRKRMLLRFRRLLKPEGSVLLDVYSLNSFDQREEQAVYALNLLDGFWSKETYYGFLNTFKYDREKVVLDKYTIVEEGRTRVVYNWLQYFSTDSVGMELEENGLRVEEFHADVAGTSLGPESPEIALVARRA